MKLIRKILLSTSVGRRVVSNYQRSLREQRRKDHLISVIFRGGGMRL